MEPSENLRGRRQTLTKGAAAEFGVGKYRDAAAVNLRTQLLRLIDRAGLSPWPRLFNALRASRATEPASEHRSAACTAWLGHTAAIAEKHDHMVREEDHARAAGETPSESGAAHAGAKAHRHARSPTNP